MTLLGFIELFRQISKKLKPMKKNKFKIEQVRFEPNPRNLKWGHRPVIYIDRIIVHQELGWGNAEQVHEYHTSVDSHLKIGVGAPAIAYHFVVEVDGKVLQVNDDTAITWHCRGQNLHSIGIMVVGDFPAMGHEGTGLPTIEQKKSLKKLLDHLTKKYELKNTDVFPHNSFGKPVCPGYTISGVIHEYNREGKRRK